MGEVAHRTLSSLKTILFQKDLRISSATNKDFSEGEISSIIMDDTFEIMVLIWRLPDIIECPFVLICASYFTFQAIGWYGLIVIVLTIAQFSLQYYRESADSDINSEIHEKSTKKTLYINESFQNIKGVKLYGWENKFIDKIENVWKEEFSLKLKVEFRNKLYDFLGGLPSLVGLDRQKVDMVVVYPRKEQLADGTTVPAYEKWCAIPA